VAEKWGCVEFYKEHLRAELGYFVADVGWGGLILGFLEDLFPDFVYLFIF
jgi:hypothetical protein